MKTIIELISNEVMTAFKEAGYDENMGKVTLSNRPDLCEYQCNGAMAGAKVYHKAPIMIANDVVAKLAGSKVLEMAEAVNPGFINLKVSGAYMAQYLEEMRNSEKMGVEEAKDPQTMILDYGGPNVAKPLHVGHLRSAIIGESIKRMGRYLGHKVIGDVHLGDWGLQMGLIITELHKRKPELVYFQEDYEGEYPTEAPFTISELEEIYPAASGKSKEDESYKAEALEATHQLQMGNRGYRALWKHVVDVKEETDTKEVPPCMILKSDGAALYTTTDLATIVERMEKYNPDEIMYVVDKRQEMHFVQVFRCAKKAGMVKDDTKLTFLGFGTMNGKDGKPFKTREGGVMRLENLIRDINEEMYKKIVDNRSIKEEDARATAKIVGLSAIKYGDLSNQASKDYIFDIERFTSFEGNTGPYILYTTVRIKSILNRYKEEGGNLDTLKILAAGSDSEKALMLEASKFNQVITNAYEEKAPHKICSYIYELANAFNRFYHETKILAEEDQAKKESYLALLMLVKNILEACIDMLGFEAPERM